MESRSLSFGSVMLLLLIAALAVFLVIRVLRRLRATGAEGRTDFDVDLEELGGFTYRQLVLISVAGLFLEMLMIRWVSSEIRIFAYFKNFVLVACFLGFGLGCYLCRRRVQLIPGAGIPQCLRQNELLFRSLIPPSLEVKQGVRWQSGSTGLSDALLARLAGALRDNTPHEPAAAANRRRSR